MSARPVVVAFVALLAAAGCSSNAPPKPAPATPNDGTALGDTVAEIVVAEDAPPTDTEYFQSFNGGSSGAQMVQDSSANIQAAVLEGWVEALTREFASPETAEVIQGNASPDELARRDHHFVGSIASAYEDAASARAALDVILAENRKSTPNEEPLAFGDGGVLFRSRFLHVPSIMLVWTSGKFLMVLTANGMAEDEIRSIAERMQSRVPTP